MPSPSSPGVPATTEPAAKVRLSQREREVLTEIATGNGQIGMDYRGMVKHLGHGTVHRTYDALLRKGLVPRLRPFDLATLTEAGREATS